MLKMWLIAWKESAALWISGCTWLGLGLGLGLGSRLRFANPNPSPSPNPNPNQVQPLIHNAALSFHAMNHIFNMTAPLLQQARYLVITPAIAMHHIFNMTAPLLQQVFG